MNTLPHFSTLLNRKTLLTAVKHANTAISKAIMLPVLSYLLAEVNNNALTLTAYDAEIAVRTVVALQDTQEACAFLLPAKKTQTALSRLKTNEVEIQTDFLPFLSLTTRRHETLLDDKVFLKTERNSFGLSALNVSDYPELPQIEGEQIVMDLPELMQAIRKVEHARGTNDVRYYLNGILLEVDNETLHVVATDGNRLAHTTLSVDAGHLPRMQMIIPNSAINALLKIVGKKPEKQQVTLTFNDTHLSLAFANVEVMTKLIDGRYPDFRAVTPAYPDKIVVTHSDTLKTALSCVSVLSNDKYKGVCLSVEPQQLMINAHNPENEEAEEALEVEYAGDTFIIGFSATYLLDVLNTITTDKVEFCFGDTNASCLIRPYEVTQTKYVVMPMRL